DKKRKEQQRAEGNGQGGNHGQGRKARIWRKRRLFTVDKKVLERGDFRKKVNAPDEYEVWKIVKDADPEGAPPADDIQITGPVTVKSGERFRVVPPGTFGTR